MKIKTLKMGGKVRCNGKYHYYYHNDRVPEPYHQAPCWCNQATQDDLDRWKEEERKKP